MRLFPQEVGWLFLRSSDDLQVSQETLVLSTSTYSFIWSWALKIISYLNECFKVNSINRTTPWPSLSLWNLAQPLLLFWCFTWTTCVCSFSLPLASHLSLQYNYSGWKATQKLLCQIAWNKTLNLRNCAKITCHPYMQYFQTLQTFLISIILQYFDTQFVLSDQVQVI